MQRRTIRRRGIMWVAPRQVHEIARTERHLHRRTAEAYILIIGVPLMGQRQLHCSLEYAPPLLAVNLEHEHIMRVVVSRESL